MIKARNYVKVHSLEEAWELNQKKSNIIVGGMAWLKMETKNKQTLIDLSGLGLDQIEETVEEFRIGCMCTLRQLETDRGLNHAFDHLFKEATKHIVGVQFRNCATIGGSIYGRYGFSDLLTALLSLDSYVELYPQQLIPLSEFTQMPYDRDVLVRIIIKKDDRICAYASQRQSQTDFPLIALAAAKKDDHYYIAIGARPAKAKLVQVTRQELLAQGTKGVLTQYSFGTNLRGSGEYRRSLAEIYLNRLLQVLEEEK